MKARWALVRSVVPSISGTAQSSTSPPRKGGSMGIGTCLGLDPRFRGGDELWEVRATFICAQLALTATHQPLTLEHVPHCRADCGGRLGDNHTAAAQSLHLVARPARAPAECLRATTHPPPRRCGGSANKDHT